MFAEQGRARYLAWLSDILMDCRPRSICRARRSTSTMVPVARSD